jgi:transposase
MRRGPGRRHQVTDIEPAPAPKVTEYVAQAKECAGCGVTSVGELPAHVRARASYGPESCAQAGNLVSGHYIPVYRATLLLCQLAGIAVSAGWIAGNPAAGPPGWWKPAGSQTGCGSC